MKMNTNKILNKLRLKIESGRSLTENEQMELMILPLTVKGNENKQGLLITAVELARKLQQESNRTFVLAGLLTFSDKIISNELADSIRRELHMLKVEKIIFEEGLEEGLIKGEYSRQIKTAIKMLEKGLQIEEIAEYTELSQSSVKELKVTVRTIV